MPLTDDVIAAVKDTLLGGGYNLLLGAGVSRDGRDRTGSPIPAGEELRKALVELKKIRPNSSLSRAYELLSTEEVENHITDAFSECSPGPTSQKVTEFVWKRIYTLNVDDCLEHAYTSPTSKQRCTSLTHRSTYRNPDNPGAVQVVHVHGWAKMPGDGYVFSLAEYTGGMGPGNPWGTILAQTIASEPFIIAGTMLEEPDLEYFLRGRNRETVRRDRGPSFLIEPFPDAGTQHDCERHGLTLYAGTFLDFLLESDVALPARPLPSGVNAALNSEMFSVLVTPRELALFSRDFAYIAAKSIPENSDLGFFVGRQPSIDDIALERDVARSATASIKTLIRAELANSTSDAGFLLYYDDAGSGKSTIALRTIYDLAAEGLHVFQHQSISALDMALCTKILSNFKFPFIIYCDNFADHVGSFRELYRLLHRNDFEIFATERSYRGEHVSIMLAGLPRQNIIAKSFEKGEARSLIAKMEQYGLTTGAYSNKTLDTEAAEMTTDCIAIAVCRVMNDFRPMERIIESLLYDLDADRLVRYVACSLATYCYRQGLLRSILVTAFPEKGVSAQFLPRDILPLSYSDQAANDYVVPTNPILGERLLREVVRTDRDLVFDIYCSLGAALGPYVDRSAIQRRTPEARLVGRLFDYDEVVFPLLDEKCEEFYLRMGRYWEWNSRYWEQFALMKLDRYSRSGPDKDHNLMIQAISHAKHAVRIERHPLPLTTLGTVLLEDMRSNPSRRDGSYLEAYEVLSEAIRLEGQMSRIAVHPYHALLSGTLNYVHLGGSLSLRQREILRKYADDVERFFPHERSLLINIANLRSHLS